MSARKADPSSIFAEAFIDRFGANAGRELETIAPTIGLKIVEVEADAFEGVLRRIKGRMLGTIALSRSVTDPRRRRFTIAHELGHYLIPSHMESSTPCRPKDIERWDATLHTKEVEANRFAASALMPRAAIADFFADEPSFDVIERLSNRQETSLTASAYRYVELSGERVAIVWSEHGTVKWARGSDVFYRRVRRGVLDSASFASRASKGSSIPDEFERVDATAWFEEKNMVDGATILEHSMTLGTYGVLTLLWIDEKIEAWSEYGSDDD